MAFCALISSLLTYYLAWGNVLAQVLLILLVRTSSCSSAAHLFIFELFVPILAQVLLIKNGSYLFLLMCCSIDGTVTKPDCFQFP